MRPAFYPPPNFLLPNPILQIQDLNVGFQNHRKNHSHPTTGWVVNNLSFELGVNEVLGVVGESGSGKSITNLAIMGLLPNQAKVTFSKAVYAGQELDLNNQKQLSKLRGKKIAMIFQDPMSSLNPALTVGYQLCEGLQYHLGLNKKNSKEKALHLLEQVGIDSPSRRILNYPFEISGGMAQRVMIAMAIACQPEILIADEPTTALDVSIQAQILELLRRLQAQTKMSILFVTHDLALVKDISHRVQVMYAGHLVETGRTKEILTSPLHPYTQALLEARPRPHLPVRSPLASIPGLVPSPTDKQIGCPFHPRCSKATEICRLQTPAPQVFKTHLVSCHHPLDESKGKQ